MDLSNLRVLHRPKRTTREALDACAMLDPVAARNAESLVLETCQRRIEVTLAPHSALPPVEGAEWLHGAAAYCFLLELAAGLKSAVLGESEILAQLKAAWIRHEGSGGRFVAQLRPWMQVILADAKEVRERYLRGTGGQSYGSLLRHELGDQRAASVLVLGAGKLATGVLPYLTGDVIRVWNRTRSNAEMLRDRMQLRVTAPIEVLESTLDAELEAWNRASVIVICVPPDPCRDDARVATLLGRREHERPRIAHLGLLEPGDTVWRSVLAPITLESLFALDRRQAALRIQRLALAHRWCESRARLRALDRCVSIAHGWEDLAGFATCGAA